MKRTEEIIFEYLLSVGLLPKHDGFTYLMEALNDYVGKAVPFMELYRNIGTAHGRKPSSVRKAIKNAIDSAIMRSGNENANLYSLQSEVSGSVKSSEFIAFSAQRIRHLVAAESRRMS